MLELSTLQKYDKESMYKIYDRWYEIASESFESDYDIVDFNNVNHIVFTGMGGSGTVGDIFSSLLSKTKIHINVVKGYTLPETVDSSTLVIAASVSGNTVETLSILKSAAKKKCKIIAFSSGGKIQRYCRIKKIEYRTIPQYHSPRASLPAYLYTMLKVLQPTLKIDKQKILESIYHLKILNQKISSKNLHENNPALSLAEWISGIPMIYYPFGLKAAAIRFKNSFQENTKTHAVVEDVIEACHNQIVAWENPANIQPILIQGKDDYIKTKERWKVLKKYFKKNNIDYKEVFSFNGNIIIKLINLIYFLDYSTIYRAVLSKTDPSPVNSIDFVKKYV